MEHIGSDESSLTAQLVEKQLHMWSSRRHSASEKFPSDQAFRFATLAADEGCLANEIARELAKLLGWHVFDKELRKFIRHYYYHDFDDLRFYDIVFNTDRCADQPVASCIQAYIDHVGRSSAGMDKGVES